MLTFPVMMTHARTTCHCDTDCIVLGLTLVSHKSQNLTKTLRISTMTDFIKSLQSLDALHKEAESWTSDNIEVTVAASYNSDEPITINLASTLGHNKRISAANYKKKSNDVHWLPSSLSASGDCWPIRPLHSSPTRTSFTREISFGAHRQRDIHIHTSRLDNMLQQSSLFLVH